MIKSSAIPRSKSHKSDDALIAELSASFESVNATGVITPSIQIAIAQIPIAKSAVNRLTQTLA